MDNAHFDELLRNLSLTADSRLLELAQRNPHVFGVLLIKMIETAVESGMSEAGLYVRISNALANVPNLGHTRLSPESMMALKGTAFTISWGPNINRPAGYYVSIPSYNGGEVVPMDEVKRLLALQT